MSLFDDILQMDKDKCRTLGKKFELVAWKSLSEDQKLERIIELADFLSNRLGIKKKPSVKLAQLDNAYGSYSGCFNRISIDKDTLSKGGILTAVTIAHEVRHSYQSHIIKEVRKVETARHKSNIEHRIKYFLANSGNHPVKDWKENFENYINEGDEYYTQPIEDDAFYYEGVFLKQFFVD